MSSIDERIVAMKFDNDQFQKGVAETTSSLDDLKKGLAMENAASSLDNISSKFNAFGAIAFTALQSITDGAIGFGQKIAGAILDPLIEGGKRRSLNIEQAKFQFRGLGMDVEQSMADALYAVKNTAFGLDEAAVAAGQFGASGVKSGDEMKTALRGISGVAAMAGTSYGEMANVFTKVAGQGRVMGDDLNRLGARGINAAAVLGKAMGKTEEEIRDMVTKGKISFADFSTAMSGAFGEHATKANETYSGSLKNLRAAFSRIGATTFTPYFERQRDLFNAITPKVDAFAEALKPLQVAWAEIQKAGNDQLIGFINGLDFTKLKTAAPLFADILKMGVNLINMVLKPIGDAFRQIFPPVEQTGNVFENFAATIIKVLLAMKPSTTTLMYLKQIFAGFFAVLSIGWEILKSVGSLFARLFDTIFSGTESSSGGFLKFAARIGVFLVEANNAIKSGDGLAKAFKFIGDVLTTPIRLVKAFFEALSNDKGPADFKSFWETVGNIFREIGEFFKPVVDWVIGALKEVKTAMENIINGMDFNSVVGLLNAGLIGGLAAIIFNFVHLVKDGLPAAIGKNFLGPIRTGMANLSITLQGMQAKLKAETLFTLAKAIALIALSIIALSFIPPDRLGNALVAMAILMGGLLKFMEALEVLLNATSLKDSAKMALVIGSVTALAVAMLILGAAVAIFSTFDWVELAKGMAGMAGGLLIIVGAVWAFNKIEAKMGAVGAGLILISTGIVILAAAMKIFASMSWEELGKGGAAITGLLGVILGFIAGMNKVGAKGLILGATSLILIAGAMTVLAGAMKLFANLSWEEIGKGMLALGATLAIVLGAMALMPGPKVLAASAALVMVGIALQIIADAMKVMGGMSWEEIGKSLVVMTAGLLILAGAMALMGIPIVLLGSVGLLAAAVAMMAIAPALKLLGTMSWEAIGRGLTVLAGALGILALGGLLMLPAIPAFLAIGIAALMIGAGAAMAGTGLLMMAAGLTALAAAAALGAQGIKIAVMTIIELIPQAMAAFAQGIIDFAMVIAGGGIQFTAAMITLITSLIDAIIETAPKVIDTIWMLILSLVDKIVEGVPIFIDAGWTIIIAFLEGIRDNLPAVLEIAGTIIAEFITGLGNQAYKIAVAGGEAVLKFINGISEYINNNSWRFVSAGSKLFRAIVDGVSLAIERGGADLRYAGGRIGTALLNGAAAALGINSPSREFRDYIMGSVFEGIEDGNAKNINKAGIVGTEIGKTMLTATAKALDGLNDVISTDMNLAPTITPILDLSSIKNGNNLIGGMLTPPTLAVDSSYAYASSIATAQRANEEDLMSSDEESSTLGNTYNFTQNNTSPKALSPAELYRQGKNLLSVVKKEQPTNA